MDSIMRRAILDSSVCVDVARGKTPKDDWGKLREFLTHKCAYFVSPLTFIELIVGLGKGQDGYYHKNLEALNVLLGPGDRFLPFPGRFVLDRAFGRPKPHPGFEPSDFKQWATVLLNAANKKQLADGDVDLLELSKEATFGFDFDLIIKPQENGIAEHTRIYEGIRDRKEDCPSSEQWADGFLAANELELTPENRRIALGKIDAALALAAQLCKLARTTDYKFENHNGDWVHSQHLYYLADPQLYIVTMDNPLRERIKTSSQAGRVVSPQELLRL
jgi:hypothetical protein